MKITESQIIEGNKLINDFYGIAINEKSMDSLMPVLKKIKHTGCIIQISYSLIFDCRICYLGESRYAKVKAFNNDTNEGLTEIECVWLTIVDFLKYLQSQKL